MCQFIPPDKDWIDLLSALITPVIAFFGIYIAYQQRSINRNRLKNELFEKRYSNFETIGAFIADILVNGRVEKGADVKFLRDTKASYLLFDKNIKDFVSEIYKKAVDLHCLCQELDSVSGEERKRNIEKQRVIKDWYKNQLDNLDEKFVEYLRLEH